MSAPATVMTAFSLARKPHTRPPGPSGGGAGPKYLVQFEPPPPPKHTSPGARGGGSVQATGTWETSHGNVRARSRMIMLDTKRADPKAKNREWDLVRHFAW